MRVTHVITRLILGGAQENTIATVLGLQALHGVHADLISGPSHGPEGSLEQDFISRGGSLTVLPTLIRPVHPLNDLRAYHTLKRHFRRARPDIVHTHSGKAGILGRLAAAAADVPVIVHTIHGPSFGDFQGATANFIFRTAERRAAKATTHFITVADAMRDQYLAAGIAAPADYTRVFSGFDINPFLAATNDPGLRARYDIAPHDIVIGKVARLFKLKGHDDLFAVAPEIIRRDPRIRFLIIGDGEWRGRFERMAQDKGLKRHFIFTGLIPPAQMPAHYGIMDLLVHLSAREGLARALPMALAAGKPVVSYDCDGASEVCHDNRHGFLVRPGHLNLLIDRLCMLAGDEALRTKFGEAGRAFVREHFKVETMVDSIHTLYRKLSANR